jgi:hypothetical protein
VFVRWLNHVLLENGMDGLSTAVKDVAAAASQTISLREVSLRRAQARAQLNATKLFQSPDVQSALANIVRVRSLPSPVEFIPSVLSNLTTVWSAGS